MTSPHAILGPTFEEMLHPGKIASETRRLALAAAATDPLDPINLYNITWRDAAGRVRWALIPSELTGVETPIVVLYSNAMPTGSHKVGAAYSVLVEKVLTGEVDPSVHTLIWPSTGNYGIGGAWVGCRMAFDSIVILPEEMSQERFRIVEGYGARLIKTPGCESNVKEIYDKSKELKAADPARVRILNQFEQMGNYRFHFHVTGGTIVELAAELAEQGIGSGSVSAFVSSMGSAGTIAAGDRLKAAFPDHKIVGLEPIQCPTLYSNGYGGHDIQGIGDKHVTWIHHVANMDALMCIDDMQCKLGLRVLTGDLGREVLVRRFGVAEEAAALMGRIFGISGICNLIGAIKTARHYRLGRRDLVVTVCTDAIDRYGTVMTDVDRRFGRLDEAEATACVRQVFLGAGLDYIREGTVHARDCWHNLKYYTWVEQQGKTVEELNAQRDPEWWLAHQQRVGEIDRLLAGARAEN